MMKFVTVVGARPQFIKSAALSRQIAKSHKNIQEILIHTGQHYDLNMSDIFFDDMVLTTPQYNLEVGSGLHGEQTGKMLAAIEDVLIKEKPEVLIVYGDTNSTLAAAVAASKLHIPIAHIEAGLRSFNRKMPEEVNRIVADHLANFLFAPTTFAVSQLKKEGVALEKIHLSGDVMYDVALYYRQKAEEKSQILEKLKLANRDYILVTVHRAENTDNIICLQSIVKALCQLTKDSPVVFPVHPRTRQVLVKHNLLQSLIDAGVQVIEPVGFLDMIQLESHAKLIMTDSGGVQKEAFFYKVPCVTLRNETEWVELVELGWNYLADPANTDTILQTVLRAQTAKPQMQDDLYGKGDAAEKIMSVLSHLAI